MTELPTLGPDEKFSQPPDWIWDCQFVEDNAAGLVLGALDPGEGLRIANHLSWCPNCARLVHEMRKTAGYLPFSSPVAVPSPSAKTRLLERIAAETESPAIHSFASSPTASPTIRFIDTPPATAATATPPTGSPAMPPRKRTHWELIAAPLAAVPLVVALAIVGGWALRTQDRLHDQVAQARSLEDKNADLSAQVSLLSSGLGDARTQRFVLDAADAGGDGGSAAGTLVGIVNQPWASLTVWNLPVHPEGYQVIVESKEGDTMPAGTFTVDGDGRAELELEIQQPLQEYRAIRIQPRFGEERSAINDSLRAEALLWMEMEGNLGAPGGTEANANAR